MDRIGSFVLNIAVALYLFANGILGITHGDTKISLADKGDFHRMANTIFDGDLVSVVTIILSVIALIAGVLLLLQLFRIAIPRIEILMLVIIIVWLVFMVIVDIIAPLGEKNTKFVPYLVQLASHLMVLGALITARTETR